MFDKYFVSVMKFNLMLLVAGHLMQVVTTRNVAKRFILTGKSVIVLPTIVRVLQIWFNVHFAIPPFVSYQMANWISRNYRQFGRIHYLGLLF